MSAPQTVEEARAAVEALQAEVEAEKAAGVRCTGHCCRSFTLSAPLEQIRQCIDYAERLAAGEDVPPNEVPRLVRASDDDLRTILAMVESLGQHEQNPVFTYADHSPHRPLDFYRCRHLVENGDCGIYDRRPKLCQDYGTRHVCQYRECTGLARQSGPAARLAEAVRQLEELEFGAMIPVDADLLEEVERVGEHEAAKAVL